jgi:hypothetical protein
MLGEDEVDEFERESFSELANAKGRGVLTPVSTRGAGGVSGLSLGQRKSSSRVAVTRDPPVAKPVDVSRDSGWEASFDGAGDSDGAKMNASGHADKDETQVNANARTAQVIDPHTTGARP